MLENQTKNLVIMRRVYFSWSHFFSIKFCSHCLLFNYQFSKYQDYFSFENKLLLQWLLQWWNSERIYTSRCKFRTGKGCGSTSTLDSNGNEYKTNQEKANLFKNILANTFSGQNNHDLYDNEFLLIPFVSVHNLNKLQAIKSKAISCILRLTFNKDTGKYNSNTMFKGLFSVTFLSGWCTGFF